MSAWTDQELSTIDRTDELGISSRRKDGTLRAPITIWVVRVRDDVYVRSAHGTDNPWFVRATQSGAGRIRCGSVQRDVTFEDAGGGPHAAIDAAYLAKYDRYDPQWVRPVVGDHAAPGTLRLVPVD